MIIFCKKHILLLCILLFSFVLLTFLNLHGYSTSIWREIIDGSYPDEIISGKARTIRSDDYLQFLPFALSQLVHHPSFPKINSLIGYSQNMLVPLPTPVWHWITIFRPQVWGFFLGSDIGISWQWWFKLFGLFYSYFLVFQLINGHKFFISLLAALALVFSPFFQFWSFSFESLAMYTALCFIFFVCLIFAKSFKAILIYSLLLAWAGLAFCFSFYPPFQILLAYLFIFMISGYLLQKIQQGHTPSRIAWKWGGLILSIGIIIFFLGLFYQENRETISIIMNTEYPGKRFSTGGHYPFWRLFTNNLIPSFKIENWGIFGNICEAASFFLFFPILGSFIFYQIIKKRKLTQYFSIFVLGYLILLLVWVVFGFPSFLSDISLFKRVPEHRTALGFGVANLILLVSYFSDHDFPPKNKFEKSIPFIFLLTWGGFLGYVGFKVYGQLPEENKYGISVLVLLNVLLAYWMLRRNFLFFVLLAILNIYLTLWFNPLVKGGTSFLWENELSKKILELNKQGKTEPNWIVFDSVTLSNLLRIIGVKSINGVHFYPQFEIWKKLDPDKLYFDQYNRFAHIHFIFDQNPKNITITSPHPDVIKAQISPDHPRFTDLGVDYLIYLGSDNSFLKNYHSLQWIYSFKDKHIYRVLAPSN